MTTSGLDSLPRWSVADLHEGFEARSFVDALERVALSPPSPPTPSGQA